jgi:hypothetical protein
MKFLISEHSFITPEALGGKVTGNSVVWQSWNLSRSGTEYYIASRKMTQQALDLSDDRR